MVSLRVFKRLKGLGEGVTLLMNDAWISGMIDFVCVSSRALWVNLKFSVVKVCVVVVYGLTDENVEEREREILEYIHRVVDIVDNEFRL